MSLTDLLTRRWLGRCSSSARRVLMAAWLSWITIPVAAETVYVAVASNFMGPMKQLKAEFEAASSHRLKVAYGSSGKIYAQIHQGAPFELFFSADEALPQALCGEGFGETSQLYTYAIGALVLWSTTLEVTGPEVLLKNSFNKLALANPKFAPYGLAAVQTLAHFGLEESSKNKWILGENIAQTHQFVAFGNADLGFVAASQIMTAGKINKGSGWRVPAEMHEPIRQAVLLLNKAHGNIAAKAFFEFARSAQGQEIIKSFGYEVEQTPGTKSQQ